jgi:hypothetical protein
MVLARADSAGTTVRIDRWRRLLTAGSVELPEATRPASRPRRLQPAAWGSAELLTPARAPGRASPGIDTGGAGSQARDAVVARVEGSYARHMEGIGVPGLDGRFVANAR